MIGKVIKGKYNLTGGNPIRLTNNNADAWLPDWSPDGTKIAFTSNR